MALPQKYAEIRIFVRGFCGYVTCIYETGYDPNTNSDAYIKSESLKLLLRKSVASNINRPFLNTFNHYALEQDRFNLLSRDFKAGIKKAAECLAPMDFLRDCTSYVMASVILKQLGFSEAPDIVLDAMYEACVSTEQHHYLYQWAYNK